jgi:hypothetical protein
MIGAAMRPIHDRLHVPRTSGAASRADREIAGSQGSDVVDLHPA